MNARIVKNLVYDFVLGWDFFCKYKCSIHPSEGYLQYENERIPLILNTLQLSSSHFSLSEDTVVPPLSKTISRATFFINPNDNIKTTDTVEVEPLYGHIAKIAVGRNISKVTNGTFPVELLNPFSTPLRIKADEMLGHVTFTTDEELADNFEPTDITLSYGGDEDSGYESDGESVGACADQEEEPPDTQKKPANTPHSRPPPKPIYNSESTSPKQQYAAPKVQHDYSTVAHDAKPHLGELRTLIEEKHADTFTSSDRDRGITDILYHEAHIKPGPPIAVPPYRTTPLLQKEMDKQVHEMIADGLVSHSTSPYSAPVLMVKKKNGEYRLVTDFRKLNARCERTVYPLPRIEDSLQKLKDPKFFSTMDLQKGFWQVPIAESDRKFFAFSTGSMHVEYNVMPMGALNSSATMQALMSLILRGLPPEHIVCFLDDILVASSTMEEHLRHLDLVLSAIGRAGLKLNAKKCLFAQESVTCLGHLLSREGIGPDPANLDKIRKWKPPRNKTEVRGFLGLTGYYRQMIQDYAKIATPLTNLTKNDAEWKWTKLEQEAFETLRDHLTSSTIMAYPDFDKPFWVKPDASGISVGYVLSQMHEKKEKVIAYGSKKLTDTQRRYCTYDREFFGILTAVRTYSHYLRHQKFFVVTDHRPLLSLKKIDPKNDATGRRVRWSIELGLYDFEIIYKKGRIHSDADAMSRLTDHNDYAEDEDFAGAMTEEEAEVYCLLGMDNGDCVTAVELISNDDKRKALAEAQDEDLAMREVKEFVRMRKRPPRETTEPFYRLNFNKLVIQDNILYRKSIYGPSSTPILQAVIPPRLIADVLKDAHGSIFSGHPGFQRMVSILQRHAIWPGIYRDTKNHVEKCQQCDIVSQPNPPAKTDLQSMNPEFVFEHVCCDLIQLPPVPAGWKYVCVFMDVFSRHVTLYKFKDKSTQTFARALEDYVTHVGCPQKLTCDNGAEFCSELVDAVVKVMGIKKKTSVVYRPQSQGMVERMNRQLIDQLTKRLHQFGKSWPEHMHYVALAHNAAPAARTGETPNLVFFGRELPIPSFSDLSVNTLRSKSVQEYVEEVQKRVKKVHETVREESVKRSAKTAEAYNKTTKHTPLQPGELVYYKEIPKNRTKTDPKHVGPVEVVARHSNAKGLPGTTYTLRFKEGETMTRNYEQLKRVKADFEGPISKNELRLPPAPRIPLPLYFDSTDDEEADVKLLPTAPIAARTRSKSNNRESVRPSVRPSILPPASSNSSSPEVQQRPPLPPGSSVSAAAQLSAATTPALVPQRPILPLGSSVTFAQCLAAPLSSTTVAAPLPASELPCPQPPLALPTSILPPGPSSIPEQLPAMPAVSVVSPQHPIASVLPSTSVARTASPVGTPVAAASDAASEPEPVTSTEEESSEDFSFDENNFHAPYADFVAGRPSIGMDWDHDADVRQRSLSHTVPATPVLLAQVQQPTLAPPCSLTMADLQPTPTSSTPSLIDAALPPPVQLPPEVPPNQGAPAELLRDNDIRPPAAPSIPSSSPGPTPDTSEHCRSSLAGAR